MTEPTNGVGYAIGPQPLSINDLMHQYHIIVIGPFHTSSKKPTKTLATAQKPENDMPYTVDIAEHREYTEKLRQAKALAEECATRPSSYIGMENKLDGLLRDARKHGADITPCVNRIAQWGYQNAFRGFLREARLIGADSGGESVIKEYFKLAQRAKESSKRPYASI